MAHDVGGTSQADQNHHIGGDDYSSTRQVCRQQRQAAHDRANQDILPTSYYINILYFDTEKPAILLVTKHAEGARRIRGNGQKTAKELESKRTSIPPTRRSVLDRERSRPQA